MENLQSSIAPGGVSKEGVYNIPKVPTFKDMENLKSSIDTKLDVVKEELLKEIKGLKKEIGDTVKKVAYQSGGNVCGICDEGMLIHLSGIRIGRETVY